uniref:KRAB domain-containing protein n=1 Tax=Podarcis muralis TaxID=64176 RepID=A0A670KF72_PODMU
HAPPPLVPNPQSAIPAGTKWYSLVDLCSAKEEWALLDPDQRALHKEVMEENRGIMASLGKAPSWMIISALKFQREREREREIAN